MQQTFLWVLALLIAGVAFVAGMKTSEESLKQSAQSELMQHVLIIAGRAQAWYRVPAQMGGGNGTFENLSFAAINFDSVGGIGTFIISELSPESFWVTGTGAGEDSLKIGLQVFADSIATMQVLRY